MESIKELRLLQIADSALAIGAAAHSFGLETLVDSGMLHAESLEEFLSEFILPDSRNPSLPISRLWTSMCIPRSRKHSVWRWSKQWRWERLWLQRRQGGFPKS